MAYVAGFRCLICKRFGGGSQPEIHHVAEGSGVRSNYSVVPLCGEHHRGATGFHGPWGTKGFIRFYKVPGDSEYGLLVWLLQDISEKMEGV